MDAVRLTILLSLVQVPGIGKRQGWGAVEIWNPGRDQLSLLLTSCCVSRGFSLGHYLEFTVLLMGFPYRSEED